MTDDELAKVLDQALKEGLYEPDDLYLFDTKLAWQLSNQVHVNGAQRKEVFAALEKHPDISPLLGLYINSGINGQKLARESLGDWLLTRGTQIGSVSAVAELRAFVDSQHCDVEEYLAISGLEVASPISLSARIDLIPITAVPESVVTI
jgi:hypothetical protein